METISGNQLVVRLEDCREPVESARPCRSTRPLTIQQGAWHAEFDALDDWVRARDYRGFDPQDILASRFVSAASLGSRWLGVAWTQVGKRLSEGSRRRLGVPAHRNPKGLGLALAAYVRMHGATGQPLYRLHGERLVEDLLACARGEPGRRGWGYPFPWANRDFRIPAHTPSGVATAFVGHALLDAAEAWDLPHAADAVTEAADFIRHDLQRCRGAADTFAFSYTPADTRVVHNASVLAASLLARSGRSRGDASAIADALRAARFTATAQRSDGSWCYGLGRRNGWVDSFHTSYLLVALQQIGECAGTAEFEDAIRSGSSYWVRAFLQGPAVSFHPDRHFPVEQHAVAHAIMALSALRHHLPGALPIADRLGRWSVTEMRVADGPFAYRMTLNGPDRRIFMRWVQCWMLLALAELAAWHAEGEERT
jgi:hypothetical protein